MITLSVITLSGAHYKRLSLFISIGLVLYWHQEQSIFLAAKYHRLKFYPIDIYMIKFSKKVFVSTGIIYFRVARLKFEKIAKFIAKNSQNSQMKIKNSHKLATFYNLRTTDMWHNSLLFVLLYTYAVP